MLLPHLQKLSDTRYASRIRGHVPIFYTYRSDQIDLLQFNGNECRANRMENEQEKKKYSAPCSSIITVERVGRSLVGRDVNSEREKGTTIMLYGRKN